MTRDEILQNAIRHLVRHAQPVDLDTVGKRVSPEIAAGLTDDEVVKAHAAVEGIELGAPAPAAPVEPVERDLAELRHGPEGGTLAGPFARHQENFPLPHANETAQPSNSPANSTPRPDMTQPQAVAAVKAAQGTVAKLRGVVQARTRELQSARGVLHDRIRDYMAGGKQFSPLDAARDFQRTAQAQRKARADAGLHGTSVSANAYVRKRMQNPTRGAFPQSWKGRTDPRFVPPEPTK